MQPQKLQLNKSKSKKIQITQQSLSQLFSIQQRQKIRQEILNQIKSLSFKNKQQLQLALKQTINKKYYNGQQNKQKITKQKITQLRQDIEKINLGLKQCQVASPIVDVFNHAFYQILEQGIKNSIISKQEVINLWDIVPARDLSVFLQKLQIYQQYKALDKQKFVKNLNALLTANKIQQVCIYYQLNPNFPQFQSQILFPKLLITDQIYTPPIIQLLRSNKQLKQKIIKQIDLAKSIIILQHLQQDPRNYDNVNKFILRKHYKSMTHQYDQWYIFQDKMCFNNKFIQWYCQEQQVKQQIKQSIKFRNGLQSKFNKQVIANPLYQYDQFTFSENIFNKFEHHTKHIVNHNKNINQKNQHDKKNVIKPLQSQFSSLLQYNLTEQHVHFIDNSKCKQFGFMTQCLLQHQYLGFDAQYRCTSTKYQQLGVALIQISTGKQIFLIDFINLDSDQKFIEFFRKLLSNPKIFIVGHSVQSDIKFIERTMKIQGIQGTIDIAKIFKQKFPNQTQNSLAFMTNFMTGKQLSKYEQRSNWNRRPLKKSQAHYAALDAQICLILYQMLKGQQVKLTQVVIKSKKSTIDKLIRKQNIIYKEQQQQMLTDARPKFLIDSMLKRLCSLLRNLGIDAQFMAVSNYQLMQQTAKNQNRIILTRDRKLLSKKTTTMPVYCIVEKGDSDLMLQQIKRQFNLDFSLFKPLSRCVKCNCPDIQLISTQQAMKYVNFQYQDTAIKQFWRCNKCKQVYWEGNQWKNAKKKFQGLGGSQN